MCITNNFHDISFREKNYFLFTKMKFITENNLRIWKIIFVPGRYIMKIVDDTHVLGQFAIEYKILIFRVAIYMEIRPVWFWMGTLIKKVTWYSSYLWFEMLKSEICFSGFPKKACQGCHIFWNPGQLFLVFMANQCPVYARMSGVFGFHCYLLTTQNCTVSSLHHSYNRPCRAKKVGKPGWT